MSLASRRRTRSRWLWHKLQAFIRCGWLRWRRRNSLVGRTRKHWWQALVLVAAAGMAIAGWEIHGSREKVAGLFAAWRPATQRLAYGHFMPPGRTGEPPHAGHYCSSCMPLQFLNGWPFRLATEMTGNSAKRPRHIACLSLWPLGPARTSPLCQLSSFRLFSRSPVRSSLRTVAQQPENCWPGQSDRPGWWRRASLRGTDALRSESARR